MNCNLYYWKESIDENLQEENKIIQQLSDNLKEELLIQSNKLILKESKVLKENFSPEILAKCISIIKEQKLTPGETLIQQEEGNFDCSIYFVLFGELEIYNKQKLKQKSKSSNQLGFIAHLKRGECFGERSFFSGNTECLNVRSKSFSKILKIRREDFIQLLKEEKEQYEKFIYLQDKLIFSNDISQLNQKCKSCQSNNHEIDRCPFIHFIPRKFKIIGVNQMSCSQERKNQYKRGGKKQGTLENSPYNTQALLDYLENQIDDIEAYEQQYFQFSFFKQKSRQFQQVEDDDFDFNKNFQEGMRSRQFTNDISESPFVGQLEKKKSQQCFKKKVGLVFQSPSNNLPSIHSVIEDQQPKEIQNLTKNKTSQVFYLEVDAQSNLQEQPQSQIFICDQEGGNSMYLNENSQNITDKITQQHHRFNALKKQPSKDMNNNQSAEKNKIKQESVSKIAQKNYDQVVNFDVKSSIHVLIEDNEFDLLHGKLDKYENFQYYFPKQNVKNIISQLNPSIRQNKAKKKKTVLQQFRDSQVYSKLSKSLYQLLKERDLGSCRTITRSKAREGSGIERKIIIQSQQSQSANKTKIQRGRKKMSLPEDLSHRNEQLEDSFLSQSKNYDLFRNQTKRQLQNEDPQTPPQNENEIHLVEVTSMVFKKQNKYFSNLDTSNVQFHYNYN
ncbi:cyclic nucleotide-binding domain protein (macronuclear) [Tetrahymena thermophila SB210]|uniref:Cyclic nucleotide-binding domain protein n=1 Tax=Tetrahymena thermophila (strain SB210) TaxID=312017 RepID=Q233Q5_TETTS|nr:cyclic nucleotide-binding domain protein [Tetrahymena thermophila SB210]EAR91774.2 cyclic nucleotide-binding domain protein [Tetrahymena thermophila SB210]|eukprot:XP_001012019.2 cyclic nucleotide-binding domain protein [Tetrahymena thermophila SB210]